MAEAKPKCRLYLQLPAPFTARLEARLAEALTGADAACVLLCLGPRRADENHARRLIDLVHAAGSACLVDNDPELAARLDADGVHVDADPVVYARARDRLGREASVGVNCGLSRHEAMLLAEMGADYIAFGGSIPGDGDAAERRAELIAWWSEMSVVPCIAWNVDDPAEAARLARLGADFVAPSTAVWQDDGAPASIAEIARAVGEVRRAA